VGLEQEMGSKRWASDGRYSSTPVKKYTRGGGVVRVVEKKSENHLVKRDDTNADFKQTGGT